MQNPTDQAEASIIAETVMSINDPNLNRTFTVRRKAAKRSESWYLEEPPQSEDEVTKLKDAVQRHGDKDWTAVAALVPGRPKKKCYAKWKNIHEVKIHKATGGRSRKAW
jgi:hypothetical protein